MIDFDSLDKEGLIDFDSLDNEGYLDSVDKEGLIDFDSLDNEEYLDSVSFNIGIDSDSYCGDIIFDSFGGGFNSDSFDGGINFDSFGGYSGAGIGLNHSPRVTREFICHAGLRLDILNVKLNNYDFQIWTGSKEVAATFNRLILAMRKNFGSIEIETMPTCHRPPRLDLCPEVH